jgi:hypothetical protein
MQKAGEDITHTPVRHTLVQSTVGRLYVNSESQGLRTVPEGSVPPVCDKLSTNK